VLPTIGAGLPVDGTVSQLTLPVYGGLVAEVLSFTAVLLLIREPARDERPHWRTTARGVPAVVAAGVLTATGSPGLRRLCGAFVLTAVAYVGVEVLWQPRFTDLLGGTSQATQTLGYVVVAMSLGAGAGAWSANRIPGAIGRRPTHVAAAATVLAAAVLSGLALADTYVIASVALTRVAAAAGIPTAWIVGAVVLVLAAVLLALVGDR
jgi:TM2 domain-containing membrane protein YozV